jgi:hypothetical protein
MKPSLAEKLVNAVLLLTPIIGAIVASAAVRAAEALPTVKITALDPDASETGHQAVLIATLDAAPAKPLVVPVKLSGTATSGADYSGLGTSITFPAQTPMVLVKITPIADALVEGTETVVVSLVANPAAYKLDPESTATATITDASGSAANTPGKPGTAGIVDPTRRNPTDRTAPPKPTGTLIVEITLDGAGNWRSPYKDGAYSAMKFHRTMKYTVPLEGFVGGGSGIYDIDNREPKVHMTIPNLYRYVALQPRNVMTRAANEPCGRGDVEILDEYKGMEVGDPGQPPLVPYTETWKGGGVFPSGDKTVPERDLCETRFALDTDKHVAHLIIDGSDSDVKTQITHNGFQPRPVNERFEGETFDTNAKAKLRFFDVPVPAGAKSFELSRTIEHFSQVVGKGNTKVPLRATVKWRVTLS